MLSERLFKDVETELLLHAFCASPPLTQSLNQRIWGSTGSWIGGITRRRYDVSSTSRSSFHNHPTTER